MVAALYGWGGNPQLDGFSGFLKSVIVNYTIFRKDGTLSNYIEVPAAYRQALGEWSGRVAWR